MVRKPSVPTLGGNISKEVRGGYPSKRGAHTDLSPPFLRVSLRTENKAKQDVTFALSLTSGEAKFTGKKRKQWIGKHETKRFLSLSHECK